jgi:small subunit ribosomal protein S9
MDNSARYYGTGKRKDAIARVWVAPGAGRVSVNGRELDEYCGFRCALIQQVLSPFVLTETLGQYDVNATARGGGVSGQAGALRHGISKALLEISPDFRLTLKKAGLLTRDARIKERKHAGCRRARRGKQFSKR